MYEDIQHDTYTMYSYVQDNLVSMKKAQCKFCDIIYASLSVSVSKKRSVHFDEEVEVKQLVDDDGSSVDDGPTSINEQTIDDCLELLQQADPTGDLRPDPPEMTALEGNSVTMLPCVTSNIFKTNLGFRYTVFVHSLAQHFVYKTIKSGVLWRCCIVYVVLVVMCMLTCVACTL